MIHTLPPPPPPRLLRPGRLALMMAVVVAIVVALLLAAACGGSDVAVIDHSAAISPGNSLIAEVRVTLSREARVFVEYDNPEAGRFRTALSEPGITHTIPVVRLRPESEYAYTVGVQDADGAVALGPSGKFTTGRLPAPLEARQTWVSGRSTQPLILTNYSVGDYLYYLLWDETGNIVWYYTHEPVLGLHGGANTPNRGGIQAIKQKPNGNLVYIKSQCCITEITPLGEVVDRITADGEAGVPHHDFMILEDGRILYPSDVHITLNDSANGGDADTNVVVDILNIWDPQTGRIERVWDSRDFWDISDPAQRVVWSERASRHRWTHINSVSIGTRGNFIFSSRNRRQVVSLSPDFRSIEWQLGGPDSDYSFPNLSDRFYGQHTASELPNGNILVFDNGNGRPDSEGGEYSRALELRLDHDNNTAVKVWEYRSTPDRYASHISSAFRLNNGNTIVNFGNTTGDIFDPLLFVEIDQEGKDGFRVETFQTGGPQDRARRFRSHSDIAAVMGETMLRPPADHIATDDAAYKNLFYSIRETDASLAGLQPVARGHFDVYFDDNKVIYRKEQCAVEDISDQFYLHIFPVDSDNLHDDREQHGFDNLDFYFRDLGVMWNGDCLSIAHLPGYEIARIRTGQHTPDDEQVWQAEFAPRR